MGGKACKYTGVNLFVLILTISGGFRLALAATQSLSYNVTQFVGTNVVIDCSSASIPMGSQPSWVKDRDRKIIYRASKGENSNPSKYSFTNGSKTLTVMNAQLTDATTYCCNTGLDDYCSNVVLIGSLMASVNPSNGVGVGDNVNLSCSLIYNAPPLDLDSPFPLSDQQEPDLSMFIGQTQITRDMTGDQVVGTYTVPHSIILSYNRTVTRDDAGKNLTCQVSSQYSQSSQSPMFSNTTNATINVRVATRIAAIMYPNGSRSSDDIYPLNSVIYCVGDGFPVPNVEWLDGNKQNASLKQGMGSVSWIADQQGTFQLYCSAWNSLSTNRTYNGTRVLVGVANPANPSASFASVRVTVPILLTVCCQMLAAVINS